MNYSDFYFFICGLFNDAVSNSVYFAVNYLMTVYNELEIMLNEDVVT
jgi:hypothetical protein